MKLSEYRKELKVRLEHVGRPCEWDRQVGETISDEPYKVSGKFRADVKIPFSNKLQSSMLGRLIIVQQPESKSQEAA